MTKPFVRFLAEVTFIVLLFYSNLLMGEFTRSKIDSGITLIAALREIITVQNYCIAVVAALVGHLFIEFWRSKFD